MSESGKFGQHWEDTPENRLKSIEDLLPLLVRIKEHLELNKKVKDIEISIDSFDLDNSSFKEWKREAEEKISSLMSFSHQNQVMLKDFQSQSSSSIKDLINKFEILEQHSKSIESCMASTISLASEDRKKIDKKSSKEELSLALEKIEEQKLFSNDLKKLVDSFPDKFEKLSKTIEDRKCDLLEVLNHLNEHWERMDALSSKLSVIEKKISEEIPQLHKSVEALVKMVPEEIQAHIAEIKFPESGISESKAKEIIESMVQPISLDAKLSTSRSNNNDMRINILEKKLEQMSLTVKRFELMQ